MNSCRHSVNRNDVNVAVRVSSGKLYFVRTLYSMNPDRVEELVAKGSIYFEFPQNSIIYVRKSISATGIMSRMNMKSG